METKYKPRVVGGVGASIPNVAANGVLHQWMSSIVQQKSTIEMGHQLGTIRTDPDHVPTERCTTLKTRRRSRRS